MAGYLIPLCQCDCGCDRLIPDVYLLKVEKCFDCWLEECTRGICPGCGIDNESDDYCKACKKYF